MRMQSLRRIPPTKSSFDRAVGSILDREGVDKKEPAKQNISQFHSASEFLFKFLLHENDPRWRLAFQLARIRQVIDFKPINLENALLASYASNQSSARHKYSSYYSPETIRHLARAMQNIEIGSKRTIETKTPIPVYKDYGVRYEQTRSINRGTDKRGVTGCPEALWQLQLWQNGRFLGRIGFNFHRESKQTVVTIGNIQGRKNGQEALAHAKNELGVPFGEFLIYNLKKDLGDKFGNLVFRGIVNKGQNEVQYRMTFRKTRTPILSAQ